MRELNAGGHKLRRPSFSKTLSELPEVEEPECTEDHLSHTLDATTLNVLPPIGRDEELKPSPRPRVHTMPQSSAERPISNVDMNTTTFHLKAMLVQKLATDLPDSVTSRMTKGRKSIDMTARCPSFGSVKPTNSQFRRHSFPIPPLKKCSGGSTSPRSSTKIMNSTVKEQKPHTESVEEPKNVKETETCKISADKRRHIQQENALDDDGSVSTMGSFENLKSIMPEFYQKNKRRFSMPLDPMWNRRWSNPAFGVTKNRVDFLLKYGKAIRNKHHDIPTENNSPSPKTIRTLADFMIEIPKKPRFSSFMSAEAQYSLMKGYEDKLYRRLSDSVPEYDALLKRNKTPNNTIEIKHKNTLGFLDDSDDDSEEDGKEVIGNEPRKMVSSFLTQTEDSAYQSDNGKPFVDPYRYSPPSVITDSLSTQSDFQTDPDPKKVLKSLRRLSVTLRKGGPINKHFHDDEEENICSTFTPRQRSYSLPNVSGVSFDRRLMMSYRLQNAMDILDNIKSDGEFKLSPRLKIKRGANMAEYNAWVKEWNKEFYVRNRIDLNNVKGSLDER